MSASQADQEIAQAAREAPSPPGREAPGAAAVPPAPDGQAELREDIRRTREQLGQTVQELMARADVKARAKDQARQITARVSGRATGMTRRVSEQTAEARREARSLSPAERAELAVVAASAAVLAWMSVVIARRR